MSQEQLFTYKENYLEFLKHNSQKVYLDDFRKVYDEDCIEADLEIVCKDMPKNSDVYKELKDLYDKKYYTSYYKGQRGVYYRAFAKTVCGFKKVWEGNIK